MVLSRPAKLFLCDLTVTQAELLSHNSVLISSLVLLSNQVFVSVTAVTAAPFYSFPLSFSIIVPLSTLF